MVSELTGNPSKKVLAGLGLSALLALALGTAPVSAEAAERPKVRAVTAFVRLERANYQAQVAEALRVLRRTKTEYETAGYEVQSLRISTQPFPEYTRGMSRAEILNFFHEYDQLAKREGFDAAIGPAMVAATDDPGQADTLVEILSQNSGLSGSLVVAAEDGIHWEAVRVAAKVIKGLAEKSPGGLANFNFAATAMIRPYTPFYPGSYHAGPGRAFAVALQSANVVAEAFDGAEGSQDAKARLENLLGEHARVIESVARRVEGATGWAYVGIDLSPAPLKEISIGAAIEKLVGAKIGAPGTMTAAAVITSALQDIAVRHAGYSGLMLPVLEDALLAERWSEGVLTMDELLSYSAVCGTGLDTIPLPGDVAQAALERIIGDMASLAFRLHKPLSARLMPVVGKKPGERSDFKDPFLVNAVIQPLR